MAASNIPKEHSMAESTTRGSEALFAFGIEDAEEITEALGSAREDYRVKWWWKYGQPVFDHIRADLEIDRANFGAAMSRLMDLNGPRLQVTAEVFPNGLPKPDVYRVALDIRQAR
jgi:hypothetical protein